MSFRKTYGALALLVSLLFSGAVLADVGQVQVNENANQQIVAPLVKGTVPIVIYKDKQAHLLAPTTVYINGHLAGVLPPETYMQLAVCTGDVSLKLTDVGAQSSKAAQIIPAADGEVLYVKMLESSGAQFLAQKADANEAKEALSHIKTKSQVISRYVPDCKQPEIAQPEIVEPPEVKPEEVLRQVSLGADALFESASAGFESASAKIVLAGYAQLDSLIADIKKMDVQPKAIKVVGHTDRLGGTRYNDKLSLARAQSVARYLKQSGISAPMVVQGAGEHEPVSKGCDGKFSNRTSLIACLRPDRRAVVTLSN